MSSLELKQHLISCQLLPGDEEKGMAGLPLLELGAQLAHHWPISQPGRQRPKCQICPGSKKSPHHGFYTAAESASKHVLKHILWAYGGPCSVPRVVNPSSVLGLGKTEVNKGPPAPSHIS